MNTFEEEVARRVDNGVAFLEGINPEWAKLIELDDLDLVDPDACVIGQTFCHELMRERAGVQNFANAWDAGIQALLLTQDLPAGDTRCDLIREHGFDSDVFADIEYCDLQEAWETRIKEAQR